MPSQNIVKLSSNMALRGIIVEFVDDVKYLNHTWWTACRRGTPLEALLEHRLVSFTGFSTLRRKCFEITWQGGQHAVPEHLEALLEQRVHLVSALRRQPALAGRRSVDESWMADGVGGPR